MTVQELAKQIFNECAEEGEPVTEAEALEMAEMEIKSKGIKNYTQSEPTKKSKTKREVKVDETKVHLLKMLATLLQGMKVTDNVECVEIANPQKEITFRIGSDEYSLTLTKHRPKK